MTKKIAIIGGGIGGLSAAIHLRVLGHQVTLYEKNSFLGGKMSEWVEGEHRFDMGPSVLTMPEVVDQLFEHTGKQRKDYLQFYQPETLCRYFFPDGSILNAKPNPQTMINEVEKFSPSSKEAVKHYFHYVKNLYELTADVFLHKAIDLRGFFHPRNWKRLLKLYQLDALKTMQARLKKIFVDPRLQQLFGRYATYNGSNPYIAPATLNVISHVEYALGGYAVQGGMRRLAEALVQLANELGVELNISSKVEKIILKNKKAVGLQIGEEQVKFDAVVSNADAIETYRQLIPGFIRKTNKLDALEPSLSGLVFLWGVNKVSPELDHHNILFTADYEKEFSEIFDQKTNPSDPTIYLSIPEKSDEILKKKDKESWFVLINMPYLHPGQDWSQIIQATKESVIRKVEKIGVPLRDHIETEKILSPLDLQELYGSNRGSIYGISSNHPFSAFFRPSNRDRTIRRLYFCGGSSHPGGGVPLVILSGKIVSEQVHKDLS